MIERAQRWAHSVASVRDLLLRAGYMRNELGAAPVLEVAEALDEICAAAEGADPAAHDVIAAAAPGLADPELGARREELRALAAERGLPALGRLLQGPAYLPGTARADGTAPPVPITPKGRPMTLGERKMLARRPTRKSIDALMRDPHPAVIQMLLGNPRLTEDDVVRMAARRPGDAQVLSLIGRHPKWALRPRIRFALVSNPNTPVAVSQPIVTLLRSGELAALAEAVDVPPSLREVAAELLALRPPARKTGEYGIVDESPSSSDDSG